MSRPRLSSETAAEKCAGAREAPMAAPTSVVTGADRPSARSFSPASDSFHAHAITQRPLSIKQINPGRRPVRLVTQDGHNPGVTRAINPFQNAHLVPVSNFGRLELNARKWGKGGTASEANTITALSIESAHAWIFPGPRFPISIINQKGAVGARLGQNGTNVR